MNKKILIISLIGIIGLIFVLGCVSEKKEPAVIPKEEPGVKENITSAPEPPEQEIKNKTVLVYKGSSIISEAFMLAAAAAYENKTGKHINVMGGGATLGVRATAAGDADMGGSCRPPLPELFDEEKGVYMTRVGWDALAFITHPSNPVDNITLEQAKGIVLGSITSWKEVGGPDKPIITVFRRQTQEYDGKISGVEYMARLMLFNDTTIDFAENALYFRESSDIETNVESLEYSFSVSGISSAKKRPLKVLNLDGIPPTKKNIEDGTYPLFRPLYLITKGKPEGELKEFMDWLLSNEGQKIISEQGTVNLEEGKDLKEKFRYWQHTELIINY